MRSRTYNQQVKLPELKSLTIDWLREACPLLTLTSQDTTAHKEPEIIKRKWIFWNQSKKYIIVPKESRSGKRRIRQISAYRKLVGLFHPISPSIYKLPPNLELRV
jgi:hypothetical protein